jgi:uncharacterized UBP type Zn finger protein
MSPAHANDEGLIQVPHIAEPCGHAKEIGPVQASGTGCKECLEMSDRWVHLRLCMTCGQVGCCDNSRNKHATKHYHETGHPIIRSFEPGEAWLYCYPDEAVIR